MIVSALLVLSQNGFVERQVRSQFCAQAGRSRRRRCEQERAEERR